jgi:hypothetical protein
MSPERRVRNPHPLEPGAEKTRQFEVLARKWEEELSPYAQLDHIIGFGNIPFRRLTDLGPTITKFALNKLQQDGYKGILWHFVLADINNTHLEPDEPFTWDPNKPFSMFERDRKAWLKWGKENGY